MNEWTNELNIIVTVCEINHQYNYKNINYAKHIHLIAMRSEADRGVRRDIKSTGYKQYGSITINCF